MANNPVQDTLEKIHSALIHGECDLRAASEEDLFDVRMIRTLSGSPRLMLYVRSVRGHVRNVWLTAPKDAEEGDTLIIMVGGYGTPTSFRPVEPSPAAVLTVIDAVYLDLL